MKIMFSGWLAICGMTCNSYGQPVDTVQTVDYGEMPPVYFSNKVYWERNYDKDNHLLFEGLKYNTCFIGAVTNYWENGTIKTKGQYIKNTSGNWTDLKGRGLCSVQDGEWKNYNREGKLISTVLYKKGVIVKEEKQNTAFQYRYRISYLNWPGAFRLTAKQMQPAFPLFHLSRTA